MAELPDRFMGGAAGAERVSREVLARHQRERVIELVTPVFAKRGFAGTRLPDLLTSGKVGVTNFYELFEGKEECFFACCERAVRNARAAIGAASQGAGSWADRAYLGLGAALGFLVAEPMQARLVLVEAQSAGPAAIARYNALMDETIAWLGAGRRGNPAARPLPQSFEQTAISGLSFYLQQCLVGPAHPSAAELLEETSTLVLEPIVGASALRELRRSLAGAAV